MADLMMDVLTARTGRFDKHPLDLARQHRRGGLMGGQGGPSLRAFREWHGRRPGSFALLTEKDRCALAWQEGIKWFLAAERELAELRDSTRPYKPPHYRTDLVAGPKEPEDAPSVAQVEAACQACEDGASMGHVCNTSEEPG